MKILAGVIALGALTSATAFATEGMIHWDTASALKGGAGCEGVQVLQYGNAMEITYANLSSESFDRTGSNIHCRVSVPVEIPAGFHLSDLNERLSYYVMNEGDNTQSRIHSSFRRFRLMPNEGSGMIEITPDFIVNETHVGTVDENFTREGMTHIDSEILCKGSGKVKGIYTVDITLSSRSRALGESAGITVSGADSSYAIYPNLSPCN